MKMKQMLFLYSIIMAISVSSSYAEFQVNTHTPNDQITPAVAMDERGNFVVVWRSYLQDGSSGGIFGQRFDASANRVGSEFQINTVTSGNQKEPAVSMDAEGNFVVVWHGPEGIDPFPRDIFGQLFDSNGQAVGSEFRVNSYTDNEQLSPSTAMHDDGHFVVVWESENVPADANKRSICGQLYENSGFKIGPELEVTDTNEPAVYRFPDVEMFNSGEFIVVWTKESSTNSIWRRRFDVDGSALINAVSLSDVGFTSLTEPSIAVNRVGCYAIVWDGNSVSSSMDDIYLRRYRWTNFPIEATIINSYQDGAQSEPVIAMGDDGLFVVVWQSETASTGLDIFERRFPSQCDNFGSPIFTGNEFVVNSVTADDQQNPAVAMGKKGRFVVVWQSKGQDGSGWGVFGKIGAVTASADCSGDGFTDFDDFCILADEWLQKDSGRRADLSNDGMIDWKDLVVLCDEWLRPVYDCQQVDINNDGQIDLKDYCLWAYNFSNEGPELEGDINGDGKVDAEDFLAILFHWTISCE